MTGITCILTGGSVGAPSGRAASLPSGGISDAEYSVYPGTASSSVTVASGGTWSTSPTGTTGTWLTGTGTGVNYEAYLDTTDTFSGAASNTWLSLSSSRTWSVSATMAGEFETSTGTLKIRDASSLIELASCSLVLTALCSF